MTLSSNVLTFCAIPVINKRPRSALIVSVCSASSSNNNNNHRLSNNPPAFNPYHSKTNHVSKENNSEQSTNLNQKVENFLLAEEQVSGLIPPNQSSSQPLPIMLDILNYHARIASRNKRTHQRARQLFERCITLNSADGRAWLGLAKLSMKNNDMSTARKLFRDGVNASYRNPHLLQAWGVLEGRLGQHARAKSLYDAAVRADPSHVASWVALGLWYQKVAHNIEAARESFRTGSQANPDNYYVWHVWGELERSCRHTNAAREYFRRGIAVNNRNAATYVAWGTLEDQLGNYTEASRLYKRAHYVNRRNIHAYVAHAIVVEKIGNIEYARKLLKTASSIAPRDPSPQQALGELERRNTSLNIAREYYQQALHLDKGHAPSWHAWACAEFEVGNISRARELFQEAIWAAPQSNHVVRTWHAWGTLEISQNRFAIARRYFANGLKVNSRSVALLTGLAKLEARVDNMARARDCLEIAIKAEPRRQSIWRLYEELEREYGTIERARLIFERRTVICNQVDKRLIVSDALPGDFQAGGMWIDTSELSPTSNAFKSAKAAGTKPEKASLKGENEATNMERVDSSNSGRITVSRKGGKPKRPTRIENFDGHSWWLLKNSTQKNILKSINTDIKFSTERPTHPGSVGLSPTS